MSGDQWDSSAMTDKCMGTYARKIAMIRHLCRGLLAGICLEFGGGMFFLV